MQEGWDITIKLDISPVPSFQWNILLLQSHTIMLLHKRCQLFILLGNWHENPMDVRQNNESFWPFTLRETHRIFEAIKSVDVSVAQAYLQTVAPGSLQPLRLFNLMGGELVYFASLHVLKDDITTLQLEATIILDRNKYAFMNGCSTLLMMDFWYISSEGSPTHLRCSM